MSRTQVIAAMLTGVFIAPAAVLALDFRSVADPGAVLYDAPSTKAQKLFVLSRDYPVEVVVRSRDGARCATIRANLPG